MNIGLNTQNGQHANFSNLTGNQGILGNQAMGNPPPLTPAHQNTEQPTMLPRPVRIPVRPVEEDNWEDWMTNVEEPTEASKKLHMLEERMRRFES